MLKVSPGDFPQAPGFSLPDSCMTQLLAFQNRRLLDSVYRAPSVDSLARMHPDTVFARMGRYMARFPPWPDSLAVRRDIVGAVRPNDSTAYVVIEEHYPRGAFPDAPSARPQVMTFRAYHGTWRSMLDPDLGPAPSAMFMMEGCTNGN